MRLPALVALAAIVVSACAQSAPPPAAGQTAPPLESVVARMEGDWTHLDVLGKQPTGGLTTGLLVDSMYDSLVILGPDPKGDYNKPVLRPYLATSWEQTPQKIVFTMRNDATCADGTKVNPSLVKRTMDIRLKGLNVPLTFGPGPYTTEADDANNKFTMGFGAGFSDGLYAFLNTKIVCPAGLANPEMLLTGAAGSGPYVLEEAVHGDHVTMKRREDWKWGPNGLTAKDLPAKVTYKIVTNETTAANLLLTGGLDIGKVGGVDVPRLLADKSLINKVTTSSYNYTLVFNRDPSRPTANDKVREALISAVNVDGWNQAANQGRGVVSPSPLMPVADCFDPTTQNLRVKDPSPEKAKQILLSAGWTLGPSGKLQKDGKPLTIVLVSSTVTGLGNGGEYLASIWDKAGVTVVSGITGDFNAFRERCRRGDYDACTTVYPFDQPNPNSAVSVMTGVPTPKGNNWTKGTYPDVEKAQVDAEASVGAERCKHWSFLQQALIGRWAILPLASPNIYTFSRGIDFTPGASRPNVLFFRRAG